MQCVIFFNYYKDIEWTQKYLAVFYNGIFLIELE